MYPLHAGKTMHPIFKLLCPAALAAALNACTGLDPALWPLADCAEAQVDDRGNAVFAPGEDTATIAVSDQGSLQAQHPGVDVSTDEWYGLWLTQDCPSLGGMEPPSDTPDSAGVQAAAVLQSVGPALSALPPSPFAVALPQLPSPQQDTICATGPCASLLPAGSPFNGADIIYVHGLLVKPMSDALGGGGAKPEWPTDASDFMSPGGYWRMEAQSYWATHVAELLDSRGARNRVLYVGWSPLQRVEYAAHTVLAQIADAMVSGNGVVLRDPADPRGDDGFCQPSCVLISHSTGGLVSDIAMSLAANPAAAPGPYVAAFQGLGWIPAHVRVQVGLGAPYSGNQYASAAMALAAGLGPPVSLCPPAMSLLTGPQVACPSFAPLLHSVLRDLIPEVAQTQWRPVVVATPVPVLTIAGGNHAAYFPVKRLFAAGFDDGVVNMDSGCGRSVPWPGWPSGYSPSAWRRVYDMGISTGRAIPFFSEQRFEPHWSPMPAPRASAACSPWKSPAGMVQPVGGFLSAPQHDPRAYLANHYSFIQTTETHTTGLKDCHEKPAEDVLAVATQQTYSFVNGGISGLQEETVVGRRLFKTKKWIWKRTYHRLQGWTARCAVDYAYEWVQ
jgi:hypothetical protein